MIATQTTPLALLYTRIKAEMAANGTPFADASAEAAFRTWLQVAWLDSGCTSDFACLYQPATSTAFSVGVRVATSGHKVNVWWGDGTANSYSPATDSNTTVSKTYGSAAKRPVVVIGRITRLEGSSQAYGGRLWENLRSLMYLDCGGCPLLTGSISSLPSGLMYLSCWGCPLLTGSISSPPSGLMYLDCGGCPLLTGSISSLPSGLTVLDCGGCSFTYSMTSGSRTWANNMRRIYAAPPSALILTSAMVDALLIDLSAVATWVTEKSIDLRGNCGARTSASAGAVATIQGKGVTVLTN